MHAITHHACSRFIVVVVVLLLLLLLPLCLVKILEQLPLTFAVLIMAYLLSGLGSTLSEYFLYGLSYLGIGMSVAMHR